MNTPSGSGSGTNSASTPAVRSTMSHSAAPSGPSSVDMIEVVDLDSPAAAAAAATLGEDDVIAVSGSSVQSSSWPPVAAAGGNGSGMQLNGAAATVLSESVSGQELSCILTYVRAQQSFSFGQLKSDFSDLKYFSIPPTTPLRHQRQRHIPTRRHHLLQRNHCPTFSWRRDHHRRDTFPSPPQAQNWFRPPTMT